MLETIAIVLGTLCFFGAMDRLRLLDWVQTKAIYVVSYLFFCLWSLWIVDHALHSDVEWYQLIGLAAANLWLVASRGRWRNGPPVEVSRPAPLDVPLRRFFK